MVISFTLMSVINYTGTKNLLLNKVSNLKKGDETMFWEKGDFKNYIQ
jgi:hypothetical protein